MKALRIAVVLVMCSMIFACDASQRGQLPQLLDVDRPIRSSRPVLVSELVDSINAKTVLDGTFRLTNTSDSECALTLKSKGCSCYGIEVDGNTIEIGATTNVMAHGDLLVSISPGPVSTVGITEYTAMFQAVNTGGREEVLELKTDLRVYPDVVVQPQAVAFNSDDQTSEIREHQVTVTGYFRDDQARDVAIPRSLPLENVHLVRRDLASPKEIGGGLWEHKAFLEVAYSGGSDDIHKLADCPVQLGFYKAVSRSEAVAIKSPLLIRVLPRSGLIAPDNVSFGILSTGECRSRRVLVRSRRKSPLSVSSISVEASSNVEVSVDPVGTEDSRSIRSNEGKVVLDVKVSALEPGRISGRFNVNVGDVHPITIALDGIVE